MRLTVVEQLALLESEIVWCQTNVISQIDAEFRNGFIAGLQQAQHLLRTAAQLGAVSETSHAARPAPYAHPFESY